MESDNTFYNVHYLNLQPLFDGFKNFFTNSVDYGTVGNTIHVIMIVLSLFFITLICYCAVRLLEIRKKEHEHLHHEIEEYAHHQAELAQKKKEGEGRSKNEQWRKVIELIFSHSDADWKLAIIEADLMLDALMRSLAFKGDTLGDMLKLATRDNFPHLTEAWEVHTVRNRIAHEGTSFVLSAPEAKRVIADYEVIFRDFGYI